MKRSFYDIKKVGTKVILGITKPFRNETHHNQLQIIKLFLADKKNWKSDKKRQDTVLSV